MTLRRKPNFLVLLVVGLAFLALLLGSIRYLSYLREQSEMRMSYYLLDATQQRKLALNRKIECDLRVLDGIAASISTTSQSPQAFPKDILSSANRDETFLYLGIIQPNRNATLISSDGEIHEGIPLDDSNFFQEAISGQSAVSDAFVDPWSGEYALCYGVPIPDEQGGIAGVLCGIRSDDVLRDVLAAPITTENGAFFIADESGTVIVPGTERAEALPRQQPVLHGYLYR